MKYPRGTNGEKGFTLLELSFVITIFAIMASIVLFKFQNFGTKTSFENLSQDIALRIVQAQKAAISGLLNPNFAGTVNPPAYGMYFKTSSGTPATDPATHVFTYFTDIPLPGTAAGNKLYDAVGALPSVPDGTCPITPTAGLECISTTSVTSGEYVNQICYTSSSGDSAFTCDSTSGDSANITFIRPFPDATMMMCNTDSSSCRPAQQTYIELRSAVDSTLVSTIVVNSLGEVRVYNGAACDAAGQPCD